MDAAGEADLALVNVADTGTDVLVEQGIGELGRRIESLQAADALVDVGVLVAQIRAEVIDARGRALTHTVGAEKHTAVQPSTSMTTRARCAGCRHR